MPAAIAIFRTLVFPRQFSRNESQWFRRLAPQNRASARSTIG